ncbi:hypothetical protein ACJX0J_025608, partial [Zea mays]
SNGVDRNTAHIFCVVQYLRVEEDHGIFVLMMKHASLFTMFYCMRRYGSNLTKILVFIIAFVDDMCLKIHISILYILVKKMAKFTIQQIQQVERDMHAGAETHRRAIDHIKCKLKDRSAAQGGVTVTGIRVFQYIYGIKKMYICESVPCLHLPHLSAFENLPSDSIAVGIWRWNNNNNWVWKNLIIDKHSLYIPYMWLAKMTHIIFLLIFFYFQFCAWGQEEEAF